MAFRDKHGRLRNKLGRPITKEVYDELKEREKDARFVEANKGKAQRQTEYRRKVAAEKRRSRRLRESKKAPFGPQDRKAIDAGLIRPQLVNSSKTYRTEIYVFLGIESMPEVRAFIRNLWNDDPGIRVRVTIRAGVGRNAESVGSLYDTARGASRYLAGVEHRQSTKELLENAEATGKQIFIEVEVKRPIGAADNVTTSKKKTGTKRKRTAPRK